MPVNKDNKMTGYASIDKPWLKYYSKDAINAEFPKCSIYEKIYIKQIRNMIMKLL